MSNEVKTETAESPTAPPAQTDRAEAVPTANYERQAQRRGCGVLVLSTILGALFGALLALGALAFINGGTLAYNTNTLRRDMTTAQEVQSNLSIQLESLGGQLEEVNGRLATLSSQNSQSAQDLSQLQSNIEQIEADFEQVITASKAVNEFLVGVQAMLQAMPSEPNAEPAPTAP